MDRPVIRNLSPRAHLTSNQLGPSDSAPQESLLSQGHRGMGSGEFVQLLPSCSPMGALHLGAQHLLTTPQK